MLDEEENAELRALRARAFGTDADIQDDPVALARWEELERRAREVPPAVAHPEPDADQSVPEAVLAREEDRADAVPIAGAEEHPRPGWRRRTVLLAALPIAAVVFAVAYLLGSSGATTAGAAASTGPQVAVSAHPPVLLPLNEAGVRRLYDDIPGRIALSLIARLDGANLWWVTADDGDTTCLAVDTAYGLSSSCAPTSRVQAGLGVGIDVGPGQPVAYWVTRGASPVIEVGSDLRELEAEHLGDEPSPTP